MYILEYFEETRKEVLIDLMEKYPLGCLIQCRDDQIEANHIPFYYDADQNVLWAHIAKQNPLAEVLLEITSVLIVFKADDAYVSPNWYKGKFEHHRAVPTWNYAVVHVKGHAQVIDDEKILRGVLAKLTRAGESKQPIAWKMSDAPKDFIQQQLGQIVAIRIDIQELKGKFKLSQNRNDEDILSVADALLKQGKNDIHHLMLADFNLR